MYEVLNMKKRTFIPAIAALLLMFNTAYANELKTSIGGIVLPSKGLTFDNISFYIDQSNNGGYIEFFPSSPAIKAIPKDNTVGSLKLYLAYLLNRNTDISKDYMTISPKDIDVYGGPFLNTDNSFTDAKVLAHKKNGEPYRVKITLSDKDKSNVVQTVIDGNFIIYTK